MGRVVSQGWRLKKIWAAMSVMTSKLNMRNKEAQGTPERVVRTELRKASRAD